MWRSEEVIIKPDTIPVSLACLQQSGKVRLFLCLTKCHDVKMYPVLNDRPHHEHI